MKRLIVCFLALLITIMGAVSISMAAPVHKVTLDVNFIPNWFFSKYDVDIFLNDLELDTIPHGQDYKDTFYAEEGSNTFYFFEHGMSSVKGEIKFDVNADTYILCTLACYSDYIHLSDINIETANESKDSSQVRSIETDISTDVPAPVTDEPTIKPTLVPTPVPTPTPRPVMFADIDLHSMSDDELADAAAAIKAEQRARLKTKVVLDKTDLVISVEKNDKIIGSVIDLPEGENDPDLEWSTSDKSIATCKDGQIRAIAAGNAVITCSATLSDGSVIYEECNVHVIIPVSSVTSDKESIKIDVDDTYTVSFNVRPKTATEQGLTYESNKPEIASVNSQGIITGISEGNAVITAMAVDGSGRKGQISVRVVDNRGSLGTNLVTLTGSRTGIVCEVLNSSIPDTDGIFRNTNTTTLVVGMTAAQLLEVNKSFNVDLSDDKNDIMYAGISKTNKDILYMAFKDTDGKYWMVSVSPKENKIVYGADKFTEEKAMKFLKVNCLRYAGVTAEDFNRVNNDVGSY